MITSIENLPLTNRKPSLESPAFIPTTKPEKIVDIKPKNDIEDRATITTLASQLSAAALRAKATYENSTKEQLRAMSNNVSRLLGGQEYVDNKFKHNAEVPDTEDPALLARARQATFYLNDLGKNPFAGMPRDQLELIIYDDSGSFTINERKAARRESADQEYAWRKMVVDDYFFNKNRPGKAAEFYQKILDHHRGLPVVARSQAPDGYEAKLEEWIELELNITDKVSEKGKTPNKNLSPEIAQKILTRDSSLFETTASPEKTGEAPSLARPSL